ncbi:uncharacterized protein LOC118418202 [Branchiostoma floridae]|uniref:Uncharacterized protein LOC118418202 n=1 Tax=Branchiostoma floridae TaxID=7739 RepID=A0A9J7LDD2_BRAFL|nr:uncharacterized protein LOC118418202 [Branchiostoma floridae]
MMTSTNEVDLEVLQPIDSTLLQVIEKTVEDRAQKIVEKYIRERDGSITEQRKKDIKTMTKEFCTTTTAHGVSRVAEANTTRSRVIWTIILVTCTALFVYQSAILIKSYFEYPVNVDIKVVDSKKLTFPSVTVCNNNRLRKSMLQGSRHESLLELDERTARDVSDYLWAKEIEEDIEIDLEYGGGVGDSENNRGDELMNIFLSDDSLDASTECRLRFKQLCTLAQLLGEPSNEYLRTEWSYFSREGWAARISHPCTGTEHDACDECYSNRIMLRRIKDIPSKLNAAFCCPADSYIQLTHTTFETHMEALNPYACANLIGEMQGEPCTASQLITAYNDGRRFDNWGWFGMPKLHDVQMMLSDGCSNSTASTCYRGVLPINTTPRGAGLFCCSPQMCVQSGCMAKVPGCSNPLGMESGKILDHQISASSFDEHPPVYGRLNSMVPWQFDPYYDENPRFEVDFGKTVILTGLITQGDEESVQTYAIQHGMTSSDWIDYVDEYGEAALFCGHVNSNGYNFQHLPNPIFTRHVAILPRFNGWGRKNLRVEFLGCEEDDCIFARAPFPMINTIDPSSISCSSKDCVSNVTTYRGTVRSSGNATCQDWTCPNRHFDFCLEENFCRFAPDQNSTDLVCPSVSDSSQVNLTSDPCQSIAKCPISETDDEPVFPTRHKFYQHAFAAQYCEERGKQLCSLEQLVLLNTFRDMVASEWGWINESGLEATFEEDCTNTTTELCFKSIYRYRQSNAVSSVAYCCDSLFELTEETYKNHSSAETACHDRGMESGIITHDQINASSFSDQQHTPNHARLNSRSYWMMDEDDTMPWIQVMCTEPECIVGRGHNYRGKQNVTRTGRTCQKWDSHDPQYHCTTPSLYPDADLSENYCRNIPDHPAKAPWCYTGEQDWEYCSIERCEVGCVDLKLNSVAGENDWAEFLLSSNTDDYTDITDFSMATREEIVEMGHRKEELILQCTFDKERCSLDDFKVIQNAKYGNCFTFNHGEDGLVRNTTKVGAEYGLKLTLSIEATEYVGLFGQSPGAKITIHDVGSTPFPEGNAINTKPGESTFVGLKRSSVRRQSFPYGDCTSYQERDVLYDGMYTYETCQHSCLQAALLEKCGCSDELIAMNSTLCSVLNNTQECCRQEVRKRHEDGDLPCDCHQSCTEDSYTLWLSSSMWPSDSYVWYVLENIHTRSQSQNLPLNPEELRQNLARVHVYFRDLNYELITENPTYTEESLLSGLGGLLGLYVGLSVITVFEFINLLVDVFKVACDKETKDRSTTGTPVITSKLTV